MENFVKASTLRNKDNLNRISKTKPGYYKWWATKKSLSIILSKLDIKFEDVKNFLEIKGPYFCIYVGIAINESIQKRLDWHINQEHTKENIRSGRLSTLKQSISSLVGNNMLDEIATNNFIDNLYVEYFTFDFPIKSDNAKSTISKIEKDLLKSGNLYILNIRDNHHKLSPKKELTKRRKIARQIYLLN